MPDAIVTSAGLEVVRRISIDARVTSAGTEVVRSFSGTSRITAAGVEVVRPDQPAEILELSSIGIQVAHNNTADFDVIMSQEGAEPIIGGPDVPDVTQEGVEPIIGGPDVPDVTQEGVEVIWRGDVFTGCDSGSVFYRVRFRLPGETVDLAQYTSLPAGDNSIIISEPRIDASTIDVLRGETTIGGCTFQMADPDEGTLLAPDPTTRRFTKILADLSAESQLLGARLYIEATDNPAPLEVEWLPYWAGYVTAVRFVDAITVEISGSHTTRDDSTTMVWRETSTRFPHQGYIMGGPTLIDWPTSKSGKRIVDDEGDWVARVTAVTPTYVEFDIDEDASAGYTGSGEGRAFPPLDVRPYLKDRGLFRVSNNDQQRNVFKWAERNVQPYFAEGGPDEATTIAWKAAGTEGWFPRLRCLTVRKNSGFFIHEFPVMAAPKTEDRFAGVVIREYRSKLYEDLGNKFRLYWPSGGAVPQPIVNDEIAFYVKAIDISEANPLLIAQHPVDILTGLWDELDIDYDAVSAAAVKSALGDFIVALRITEPKSLKDAQTMLCAGFGIGWRHAPDGLRYLFTTRVRPTLTGTIRLSDLISDDGIVWENEESSRVFSASYKWTRFEKWPGDEDGSNADRAFDGVMPYDVGPIVFQTADLDDKPYGSRDEQYEIPGSVYALESGDVAPNWSPADHVEITANLTAPILEQFARGAIQTTLNLNHCILVQEGEDWELELPHRPGFDALESPVAQRGIVERVQCISRTPQVWGSTCTFVRVPQDAGSVVPSTPGVATAEPITLSVVVHDATATGGNVIDENDIDDTFVAYPYYSSFILDTFNNDYYDILDAEVVVDYYEGPAEPAEGLQTRYPNAWDGLRAIEIGGFTPASKVWYRTQVRLGNGYIFPFSLWASVQLANTTQAGVPTVSLTPDGSFNIDADIVAPPTTVRLYVAADTAGYPDEVTTLAETPIAGNTASIAAIIPTLAEAETAYVTAIAEDIFGNRSIVSTSFFTRPGGGTGGGGGAGIYAGAMREIATVVTSGSQSSVTFSGIVGTYKDLKISVSGRSQRITVNADAVRVRFNGDSGSNYEYARIGRAISGTFADGNASQTSIWLASLPTAASSASLSGGGEILVPNYSSTAFRKSATGISTGGGVNDTYTQLHGGHWRNTAAITQVEVFLENGPFVDGSVVTLYGIGGEVGGAALAPIYTKYDPDCPPSSPSAINDEFMVDGSGLPAGWTSYGYAPRSLTNTRGGRLMLQTEANAGFYFTGAEKVLPSGPFTVVTLVKQFAENRWNNAGIYVRSSVSDRSSDISIYTQGGSDTDTTNNGSVGLITQQWTNRDTRSGFPVNGSAAGRLVYLRICYDGTNLYYESSNDGLDWATIRSEAVGSFFTGGNLPDRCGIAVRSENATRGGKASFKFFRYFPTAFADIGRNIGVGSDGALLDPMGLYLHNKVI